MPVPSTTTVVAHGLDGVTRTTLPARDFSQIPTVQLAFLAKCAGMPADWVGDAVLELERRRDEALEYTGQQHDAIRLPTGYRFVGGN